MRIIEKSILAGSLVLATLCCALEAQVGAPSGTVLDGVFSAEQAQRGRATYMSICGECHGGSLEGVSAPALRGDRFIERWREDTLDSVFGFIRERMPPGRSAAQPIPQSDYVDILAFMLEANDYDSGATELTAEALTEVMLVGAEGPQPVPDGSLVLSVGCLTQTSGGSWLLTQATAPRRTRVSTATTAVELARSQAARAGTLSFRLTTLGAVPDFAPAEHINQRILAKGYLVRQPNAERIGVSAVEVLDPTCGP